MTVYLSRGEHDPECGICFPATPDSVWTAITELDEHCASSEPIRIVGALSPVTDLCQYISCADMEEEADILKLNMLAGLLEGMTAKEQGDLSETLAVEKPGSLDGILQIMDRIAPYETVEGVNSDKELGGWLVAHGLTDVDFTEAVRPYLDYAGIGAEYRTRHGGTYTPQGYAKRREGVQTQKAEDRSSFALTLSSPTGTYRLDLPAPDAKFEQARGALGLDSLDSAVIGDVEIGYSWAHLLPINSITLDEANLLAQFVQRMSESELRTFGAALEAEEPAAFSDAVCIAENIDDYELVDSTDGAYGRDALRKAGATDEVFGLLDGFTDFDALGRSEMEADGVRETSFGSVRRLSVPWPRQEPTQLEPGMTIGMSL